MRALAFVFGGLMVAMAGVGAAQTPAKTDTGKLDIMLMKPTAVKTRF